MAMIEELAHFPVALIADGLDALGLHRQVLAPGLRMLARTASGRFVGRARTLCMRGLADEERSFPTDTSEKRVGRSKCREALLRCRRPHGRSSSGSAIRSTRAVADVSLAT